LHQRLLAEVQTNEHWHVPVTTCACALAPDGKVLAPWSEAVEGYRAKYKERDPSFDRPLQLTNIALGLTPANAAPASRFLEDDVTRWLGGAFPLYARTAWAEDDARNRAWIAAAEPLVARWGNEIAPELAMRLEARWPSRPVRVEVSRYAGWSGAYTTPNPIFVTVSSEDPGYQGSAALEMLFHEASHGLTRVLDHDLEMTFLAQGKEAPRALEHVIIFYTAGELVRRRLGAGYVPYAEKNGVYRRGWSNLEAAVRAHWQPWLDGKVDISTAIEQLARSL
jgi:hypothetical protein